VVAQRWRAQRCLERHRSDEAVEEEEMGGAPFIAARGGGTKVARRWNHGWKIAAVAAVGMSSARSRHRRPDSEADERAPRGF
jgi:hypothetical protein